jgi:hypothetical protein
MMKKLLLKARAYILFLRGKRTMTVYPARIDLKSK